MVMLLLLTGGDVFSKAVRKYASATRFDLIKPPSFTFKMTLKFELLGVRQVFDVKQSPDL